MKSIKPDEFFIQVSINSRVADLETVKSIYYGIVRTMTRELKSRRIIKMPDWGEFYLRVSNPHLSVDVNTGLKVTTLPRLKVKFLPDYKLRKYFYKFGEDNGFGGPEEV